jgi:FAD/FMN-containing dehydrogenase
MGLTGIILRAAIRLRPVETGWIRQTTIPAPNLKATMAAFEQARDATYSVAWIDCLGTDASLGRSLVMLGEHATRREVHTGQAQAPFETKTKPKLSIPFDFPSITLNRYSVRVFNVLYYWAGTRKTGTRLVDWDSYFYPLDAILGWNRIYGRKGFIQFQCVLPIERSEAGLTALLAEVSKAGTASFLAVLKRLGPQNSPFSFPMAGYTLALDFPVTAKTLALLDRLDQITMENGGRFYLAKDSRMSAATLRATDKRAEDFQHMRERSEVLNHFRSAQADRLAI